METCAVCAVNYTHTRKGTDLVEPKPNKAASCDSPLSQQHAVVELDAVYDIIED